MELELLKSAGDLSAELVEIQKFENGDDLDAFVSITPLCMETLTIICC